MKTVLVVMLCVLGLAALVSLQGCAEYGVAKTAIAVNGAKIADEELVVARWVVCDKATVGAVRRKYANDPAGLKAWQDYCSTQAQHAIAPVIQVDVTP